MLEEKAIPLRTGVYRTVEAHIGEEGGIVSEDEGRPFSEQHRTLRYLWYHYDINRSTRVMHRNF